MMIDYVESNQASVDDLKPRGRLYRYEGTSCYVARIGTVDDWAAYKGKINQGLDMVAGWGVKIDEESASKLFPVCVKAGLAYRLS